MNPYQPHLVQITRLKPWVEQQMLAVDDWPVDTWFARCKRQDCIWGHRGTSMEKALALANHHQATEYRRCSAWDRNVFVANTNWARATVLEERIRIEQKNWRATVEREIDRFRAEGSMTEAEIVTWLRQIGSPGIYKEP